MLSYKMLWIGSFFQRIDTPFGDDYWLLKNNIIYRKRLEIDLNRGGNDSSVPDYPSLACPPEE